MKKSRSLLDYRLSFRLLLSLSALAISLFTIMVIGVLFYGSASRFLTERNSQLDSKRFSQAVDRVSGRLDLLESITAVNVRDSELSDAAADYLPDSPYAAYRRLNDALDEIYRNVQFVIPELQDVMLLCDDYSLTAGYRSTYVSGGSQDVMLSHFLFSSNETCIHFPGSKAVGEAGEFSRLDGMILLSTPVLQDGSPIGTLLFVITPSFLWDQLPADERIAVVDKDGAVLHSSIELPNAEIVTVSKQAPSDSFQLAELPLYGLTVVYQNDTVPLRSTLRTFRLVYFAAGMVILAVSYAMANLFSRPFVRPLQELETSFDAVQSRESLNRQPRFRRLSSKEYFLFFLSVIVYSSGVLFSLFAFFYYRSNAAGVLESSISVSYRQAVAATDDVFENINYNSIYLSYSDDVSDGLTDSDNELSRARLKLFLEESAQAFRLPLEIYLADPSPKLVASSSFVSGEDLLLSSLPERKTRYSSIPYRNGSSMLVSSQIIDLRNYKPIGYLILQVDELYLRQCFDLFPSEDYTVFLHTPEDLVLSSSDEASVGKQLPSFGRQSRLISEKLLSSDLYLTLSYDNSALTGALTASLRSTLYFFIVLFGILLLVNELLSRYLSERFQTLSDMLTGFSPDSLEGFQPQYSIIREINSVYAAFGEMTQRIRTLIDDNVRAEQRERALELGKRQAELLLLQSQINPHFLYNTFAAVNSAIEDGNGSVAIHTLNVLADMLRFSTKNTLLKIPVSEEIRYAKMYMDIMCMRNRNLLSASFDFSEEALKQETAKFILQPILENAISHGFEPKGGLGTIRVTGMVVGSRLIIVIRDNGVGITPAELESLNAALEGSEPRSGIGLPNIANRLRLIYGEEASLTVDSQDQDGCVVTIIQPIRASGENTPSRFYPPLP